MCCVCGACGGYGVVGLVLYGDVEWSMGKRMQVYGTSGVRFVKGCGVSEKDAVVMVCGARAVRSGDCSLARWLWEDGNPCFWGVG